MDRHEVPLRRLQHAFSVPEHGRALSDVPLLRTRSARPAHAKVFVVETISHQAAARAICNGHGARRAHFVLTRLCIPEIVLVSEPLPCNTIFLSVLVFLRSII